MSARTEAAAIDELVASLQRAISSVTHAVLVRRPRVQGQQPSYRFPDVVRLRGPIPLDLLVTVEYGSERADGGWVARVAGYRYELRRVDGPMLLAYHWHPVGVSPVTAPHLHLGGALAGLDLSKAHLPTGAVTLQAVLRFAVTDLGVDPLRDDWRDILTA